MNPQFWPDEGGGMTLFHLFWVVIIALLGGAAIDTANAFRVREILQSNAESAAVSAAIAASQPSYGESAKDAAKRIAKSGLAAAGLSNAWTGSSFEMGHWSEETRRFTPTTTDPNAVHVSLSRSEMTGNAEPQLILGLFRISPWDILGDAVALFRFDSTAECIDPLLSLKLRADLPQPDVFAGICLYAQATAEYGGDPIWKSGKTDEIVDGILAAAMNLPLSNTKAARAATNLKSLYRSTSVTLQADDLSKQSVIANAVIKIDCDREEVVTINDGAHIDNAMIISPCPIRFRGEVTLNASLVIHNLNALLRPADVSNPAVDEILTGSPKCAPGDGVRLLLFADISATVGIPALAPAGSPAGDLLSDAMTNTGGSVSSLVGGIGQALDNVTPSVNDVASSFDKLPICLNIDTMVTSETIILR